MHIFSPFWAFEKWWKFQENIFSRLHKFLRIHSKLMWRVSKCPLNIGDASTYAQIYFMILITLNFQKLWRGGKGSFSPRQRFYLTIRQDPCELTIYFSHSTCHSVFFTSECWNFFRWTCWSFISRKLQRNIDTYR